MTHLLQCIDGKVRFFFIFLNYFSQQLEKHVSLYKIPEINTKQYNKILKYYRFHEFKNKHLIKLYNGGVVQPGDFNAQCIPRFFM